MLLGNMILDEIHPFLFERLDMATSKKQTTLVLSDLDHSCLRACEEAFEAAHQLVNEQEGISNSDTTTKNEQLWEKGQHFLLRGRARQNLGISFLEQSECEVNADQPRLLLKKALKSFEKALDMAKKLRFNTVASRGELDLNDSRNGTVWESKINLQHLEALQLGTYVCPRYGLSLWKLGRIDDAEEILIQREGITDAMGLAAHKGVERSAIAELMYSVYDSVRVLVDVAVNSLEAISGRDEIRGDKMLQLALRSIGRAIDVVDEIVKFENDNSLEKNVVLKTDDAKAELHAKEKSICGMWEEKKAEALKPTLGPRAEIPNSTLVLADTRGELQADADNNDLGRIPRSRIILSNDRHTTSRRPKKNNPRRMHEELDNATDSFNAVFVHNESVSGGGLKDVSSSARGDATQYRKWGDEVLEASQRKKYPACCPPLPSNIPLEHRVALQRRYSRILPKDEESKRSQ